MNAIEIRQRNTDHREPEQSDGTWLGVVLLGWAMAAVLVAVAFAW